MYNHYVDQQVDTFERHQREQQAAMQRMAQSFEADRPTIWALLHNLLRSILNRSVALVSHQN
ncbi:MAG: hypothetical protein SH847_16815 [Roseiflexaceae bacterium]|nr:hypothetical protein [Roseiflexaceae bacterium]